MMAMVVAMVVTRPVPMAAAAGLVRGGMAVVVQMFFFRLGAVFAAVAFEHAPLGQGVAGHLGVEQREDALSKPKCVPSAKAICGYCCAGGPPGP
jgi:hypothetical protein